MLFTAANFGLMLYALLRIIAVWHAGQVKMLDGTILSLKSRPLRFVGAMAAVTAVCLIVLGYTGFQILDMLSMSWAASQAPANT